MLEKLKINNVALIKTLEIDFSRGFNVILGETGAGKSIIIDALNFVLGSKADKTLIRAGEDIMKVVAVFNEIEGSVVNILNSFGIEADDQIILSRNYNINGKGEARINGEIVSVNMLKQVGEALVDAYSQNESVALLKQKNHLGILDSYKASELLEIKEEIEELIFKLNSLSKEIKNLGGNESNRERQIDMLRYQISEIENANVLKDEDIELEETLSKCSHSEKIMSAVCKSIELLENENGALSQIRQAISSLKNVEIYDQKIEATVSKAEECLINFGDVSENLFTLQNDYNFDENLLNKLIDRRELLDSLKRKYGGSLERVFNFLEDAKNELTLLENAKEILKEKEVEKQKLLQLATKKFEKLSQIRKSHAKEIEQKVSEGLYELGILKSKFKVNFIPLAESLNDLDVYSLNCLEDVEFLFSANFGEELKPLAKTISGGEMSRFMLVFKNIIADVNGSKTLIFDEIDSGISGQVAGQVAQKIAKLSLNYQILCITHLPQVASMGDCFYFVSKSSVNERTETEIKALEPNEISKQISLLTYGNFDDKKLELTNELLENNKKFKKSLK